MNRRPRGTNSARVAVIGAGPAGLAAIKALREVGIDPVAFEALPHIGGVWADVAGGDGPGYSSLRMNTSSLTTAFSDMPFPMGTPAFPARPTMERYLHDYASRFDLIRSIRFHDPVTDLTRTNTGEWQITSSRSGDETFDAVAVCIGVNRTPMVPALPGLNTFTKPVLHSYAYNSPNELAAEQPLVVGLGPTAVDIASDLCAAGTRTIISTRRGAWIVPREIDGVPVDYRNSRIVRALPTNVRAAMERSSMLRAYAKCGLPAPQEIWDGAGIPFAPRVAPTVRSDTLHGYLASGMAMARPGITGVTGDTVHFADGTSARPDAIVFGTGYLLDFPFLPAHLRPWSSAATGLYGLVFPPRHPSLSFLGVCRVQGSVLPLLEMQARWVAAITSGALCLPTAGRMQGEVRRRIAAASSRNDLPFRTPLYEYLDQLALELDVGPRLRKHPLLAPQLLWGPPLAAHYRLDGPHRWDGAANFIRAAGNHALVRTQDGPAMTHS